MTLVNALAGSIFPLLIFQQFASSLPLGVKYHVGAYLFIFIILIAFFIDIIKGKINNITRIIPLFLIVGIFYFFGHKDFLLILFSLYIAMALNNILNFNIAINLILLLSLFISFFQISGIHEIFHLLNSQYGTNSTLKDILFNYSENEFRSQQVRPSGILHSSGLLSQIYCFWIALIVLKDRKNHVGFFLIPFLIVFSGSKIVLAFGLIAIVLSLKISFDFYSKALPFLLSSIVAILFHLTLFGNLLIKQFELLMIFQAIKFRLHQYFIFEIESSDIFFAFIIGIIIFYYFYKPEKQRNNFILLIILLVLTQITNYTFTTPIIAILFYGTVFNSSLNLTNQKYLVILSLLIVFLLSILNFYFPQV